MKIHPYQQQILKKWGIIAAAVLLPLVGFFTGVQYQKHQSTAVAKGGTTTNGGQRFRSRFNLGSVTAISDTSITVKLNSDGGSHTYAITSSTAILNSQRNTISASDIKVGDNVVVMPSSTDSTQAGRILVNPTFGGGFGASGSSTSAPTEFQTQ